MMVHWIKKKKTEISPFHLLNSKKQNSSLPLVQAGCLEIEERKKEIFFFSVADQNFKGGEGMLMQLGRDGLTQCLRLFKIPDKTLEIPMQQILQDIEKKNLFLFLQYNFECVSVETLSVLELPSFIGIVYMFLVL